MKGFGLNVGLEFFLAMPSGRLPVIRRLLIIQVPDTGDKGSVPLTFRPVDCFSLRFEGCERVVGMVFHDIFVDVGPLGAALGVCFNVDVRNNLAPITPRPSAMIGFT
jgi:hypothetical protein